MVDEFYDDYKQLLEFLKGVEATSLRISMNDKLSRALVLVSANYFEGEINGILVNLFQTRSGSPLVTAFLKNSMERRFHEYFDWKAENVNRFFGLFGEDFKKQSVKDVRERQDLEDGVRGFIEIERMRNILAHEQLLGVPLPKTADEYYELHTKALVFIEYLRARLR